MGLENSVLVYWNKDSSPIKWRCNSGLKCACKHTDCEEWRIFAAIATETSLLIIHYKQRFSQVLPWEQLNHRLVIIPL